jgi:hypothetical protein
MCREADRRALVDLVYGWSTASAQCYRMSTDFSPSSIPPISATNVLRYIQRQGDEVLYTLIEDISGRTHYMNLLTDPETVLRFNFLHALLMNPNYPEATVPFDTYENRNFTSENYDDFYEDVIKKIKILT